MRNFLRFVAAGCAVCGLCALGCGSSSDANSSGSALGDGTHGPQKVAAGSTLESQNPGGATVASGETGAAIVVETEPGKTTTVKGIKVTCRGGVGLLIRGGGTFVGDNLELNCSKGIGVAAEGQSGFRLSNTKITGTITKDLIPNLVFPLPATQAPVIGMALSKVTGAELSNVTITGFGGFGAVSMASSVTWNGGGVSGNVGVGLMQDGGDLALNSVDVSNTWAGQIGSAISSYGVVVAGKGVMTTSGLSIQNNEGYGLLQDGSSSSHTALSVKNNGDVGMWLQNAPQGAAGPSLKIEGADSKFEGNKGGGLFAINSGGIELRGCSAAAAMDKQIAVSETGLDTMADGVQINGPTGDVTVENVTFSNNMRVGLLLSGSMPAGAKWSALGVTVGGSGKHGVIAQQGFPPLSGNSVQYSTPTLQETDAAFKSTLGTAMAKGLVVSAGAMQGGLMGSGGVVSDTGDVRVVVDKNGMSLPQ